MEFVTVPFQKASTDSYSFRIKIILYVLLTSLEFSDPDEVIQINRCVEAVCPMVNDIDDALLVCWSGLLFVGSGNKEASVLS